jgi:hypothetical protein
MNVAVRFADAILSGCGMEQGGRYADPAKDTTWFKRAPLRGDLQRSSKGEHYEWRLGQTAENARIRRRIVEVRTTTSGADANRQHNAAQLFNGRDRARGVGPRLSAV